MKLEKITFIIGMIGSGFTNLIGGWTTSIATLIMFMTVDYITGIIDGLLLKSNKTETGGLSSKIGFVGLAKKCMMILFLFIGCRLDIMLNSNYIRDCLCIGFIINELISITENASLLGFPTPAIITNVIDILKKKTDVK